ncbi:hypothetical protein FCH28_35105 [Streptomyces piniterrae]|uniref:Uncharacterized protein n=1 Tax=Streptomyces piniterrae TaxID=2571125 RepID=A0A4U0MN98_9ACTN|nr:hypothetical protein FCH28_35105 [Streptomyces piniterrae]
MASALRIATTVPRHPEPSPKVSTSPPLSTSFERGDPHEQGGPPWPPPHAELCPRCGGQLAVNQDGWKICHACGYASPPGTAPPPRAVCGGIVAPTVATPRRAR